MIIYCPLFQFIHHLFLLIVLTYNFHSIRIVLVFFHCCCDFQNLFKILLFLSQHLSFWPVLYSSRVCIHCQNWQELIKTNARISLPLFRFFFLQPYSIFTAISQQIGTLRSVTFSSCIPICVSSHLSSISNGALHT